MSTQAVDSHPQGCGFKSLIGSVFHVYMWVSSVWLWVQIPRWLCSPCVHVRFLHAVRWIGMYWHAVRGALCHVPCVFWDWLQTHCGSWITNGWISASRWGIYQLARSTPQAKHCYFCLMPGERIFHTWNVIDFLNLTRNRGRGLKLVYITLWPTVQWKPLSQPQHNRQVVRYSRF